MPAVGLLELEDAESGARLLLDTNSRVVRGAFQARRRAAARHGLRQLTRSAGVDLIEVTTDGGHLDALVRFFRLRERRRRKRRSMKRNCKLQIANCKLQIEDRNPSGVRGFSNLQFAICNLQFAMVL